MGHVFFYSALKVIGAVKITLKTHSRKQFSAISLILFNIFPWKIYHKEQKNHISI